MGRALSFIRWSDSSLENIEFLLSDHHNCIQELIFFASFMVIQLMTQPICFLSDFLLSFSGGFESFGSKDDDYYFQICFLLYGVWICPDVTRTNPSF